MARRSANGVRITFRPLPLWGWAATDYRMRFVLIAAVHSPTGCSLEPLRNSEDWLQPTATNAARAHSFAEIRPNECARAVYAAGNPAICRLFRRCGFAKFCCVNCCVGLERGQFDRVLAIDPSH